MPGPSIVWFRLDLRLDDNPALAAAVERGRPLVPLYVFAPDEEGDWPPGAASRWWLHQSLASLDESLRSRGSRLIIQTDRSLDAIRKVIAATGADVLYWNRRYEPALAARDAAVESALRQQGIEVQTFSSALLFEPGEVLTGNGQPYRVFTPFYRACLSAPAPELPRSAPATLPGVPKALTTLARTTQLDALELEPKIDWAAGMRSFWRPGERGAAALLDRFIEQIAHDYDTSRERPARDGTSRLSPHLHHGEISVRRVWHALREHAPGRRVGKLTDGPASFLREFIWREFAHQLLHFHPRTPTQPLNEAFTRLQWRHDPAALRAWQRGRTGYPIVDAGMRQLWKLGWMHNRVRLIVGSFLVKDLLIPWQQGAAWFWDTLVDADLANNTMNWQWVAGCGADAAPFFRVFNPVTQGKRYDAEGEYVRRWVPELAKLPEPWIHEPWAAPPLVLAAAGVRLGEMYPQPIVDHAAARQRALDALGALRGVSRL